MPHADKHIGQILHMREMAATGECRSPASLGPQSQPQSTIAISIPSSNEIGTTIHPP